MAIVLDLIQTAGIIASLVFAIFEMRLYVKSQRVSVMTRISERNDALLQDIMTNSRVLRSLARPFHPKAHQYLSDPRVSIMYRTLNFFDEMLFYFNQGEINKGTWVLYQTTLKRFMEEPFAVSFWNHVRPEYSPEFQQIIDGAFSPVRTNAGS